MSEETTVCVDVELSILIEELIYEGWHVLVLKGTNPVINRLFGSAAREVRDYALREGFDVP
jgi:hypothetical protein